MNKKVELCPELQIVSDLIKAKDREIRRGVLNELDSWFGCNMPMVAERLSQSESFQRFKDNILA